MKEFYELSSGFYLAKALFSSASSWLTLMLSYYILQFLLQPLIKSLVNRRAYFV